MRIKTGVSLLLSYFSRFSKSYSILNEYVKGEPDSQNALDIFKNEWASKMPPPYEGLKAGGSQLFEDARVSWAEKQVGGFQGRSVLELGPLEAGHTYMMEKMGAGSILSIEANTRAYLKCLIVKELLNLKRSRFLLGDFVEYLKNTRETFDICFASGVLYHMLNPAELIYMISRVSKSVILWTHYYDQSVIKSNPNLAFKYSGPSQMDYNGFKHRLFKQTYRNALKFAGFCGGGAPYSYWMERDSILSCLRHFGFDDLRIEFDDANHPNGPAFAVAGFQPTAVRSGQ